jgi:hypothetical protein
MNHDYHKSFKNTNMIAANRCARLYLMKSYLIEKEAVDVLPALSVAVTT